MKSFALALLSLIVFTPQPALAIGECKFKPSPPTTLPAGDTFGLCKFDLATLSYAGDGAEQARCLLNPVRPVGRLGPPLTELPRALAERAGRNANLPERSKLQAWLAARGLGDAFNGALAQPVSSARDNDPASRPASYFVIHDTSTPNYGSLPWPQNIDADAKVNNLNRYRCSNRIE